MDGSRSVCVLVVDDDASIRKLLVAVLRREGYRMVQARNGREALVEMRAGCTDLVIMDLVMPEVSGWQVLEERIAEPALLRIPVIVVSASNTAQAAARLLDQHVFAVISKPFDLEILLEAVTSCLARPDLPSLAAA
ncbi:MAG TPA: response regulator [Thermoanaerobaculia bacterium]|jgi:CheY-like chemotaxis protein